MSERRDSQQEIDSGSPGFRPEGSLPGSFSYGKVFAWLLAFSALARLLYAPWVPLTGDELMHWQWARHLDLGYPEHPPLIAWSMALTTTLFGHHPLSLRLIPVLASTFAFAGVFRLGRELFGPRAGFFAAVPLMTTPIFNLMGVMATTDSLLAVFWVHFVLGVKRAVIDGRRSGWLLAGISAGFALLSKLSAGLLLPATALFLLATPAGRRELRRWEPYAAAGLSALLFSPAIVWNLRQGWLTVGIRFGHHTVERFTLQYVGELLLAQFLAVSPVLFPWVLWGLWKCWWQGPGGQPRDPRLVLLGSYTLVPLATFFAYALTARAGLHWPAMAYLTGFLAAGALTARAVPGRGRFLFRSSIPSALITLFVFSLPFVVTLLPRVAWPSRPDKVSTDQARNLFDWGLLGEEIQRRMVREDGRTFLLVEGGYGIAGLAAFYTPSQPDIFLWHNPERNGAAYNQWKADADLAGWDAVIVSDEIEAAWFDELHCCFATVLEPEAVEIRRSGQLVRTFYLFRATGFSGFPEDQLQGTPARDEGSP